MAGQKFMKRTVAAAMTRQFAVLSDYQSARLYPPGFEVLRVNAVIADQRIGKSHELSCIGRVRQDFLITGHAGVEHHFSKAICLGTEAHTFVD